MRLSIILFSLFIYVCSFAPAEPTPCEDVDFSGTARWMISPDSLMLSFDKDITDDFIGSLVAKLGVPTDSGRQVTAYMVGTLTTPLGERSKVITGSLVLSGMLSFSAGEYQTVLRIVSGSEGFSATTGYIELDWREEDEFIYHGGTFCL